MGYTIRYSPQTDKRYPPERKRNKSLWGVLTACILVALFFAVKYRTAIVRFLSPGDPDTTSAAIQELVSDFREGSAEDAVMAFGREMIDNAAG